MRTASEGIEVKEVREGLQERTDEARRGKGSATEVLKFLECVYLPEGVEVSV